jgi:hypothetical protein
MTDSTISAAEREKANGLGIKAKLLLAFAGVAGLTLIGSAVALVSYARVDGAFDRVTGDGLPAITQSLQLAREAAEVTALAPVLLAADTQPDLAAARTTGPAAWTRPFRSSRRPRSAAAPSSGSRQR